MATEFGLVSKASLNFSSLARNAFAASTCAAIKAHPLLPPGQHQARARRQHQNAKEKDGLPEAFTQGRKNFGGIHLGHQKPGRPGTLRGQR